MRVEREAKMKKVKWRGREKRDGKERAKKIREVGRRLKREGRGKPQVLFLCFCILQAIKTRGGEDLETRLPPNSFPPTPLLFPY